MSKKSHHFLTLWPWPLTYDLEKLIRSGHYHYQCVYQIWEQSIPGFLTYRVNTIAGGGRRAAGGGRRATGGGRLWRKTITSPDPSDTGDIIKSILIDDSLIINTAGFFSILNTNRIPSYCGLESVFCILSHTLWSRRENLGHGFYLIAWSLDHKTPVNA